MGLTRVDAIGLFGIFNHTIPLYTKDRVTIIHGSNGIGKTVLLNILNGLFNGDLSPLIQVPFTRTALLFDDGSSLTAVKDKSRHEAQKHKDPQGRLLVRLTPDRPGVSP